MLKQCNRQWKHVLHQLDSAHLFVQHFVVCRAASTASSSIPELLEMREYTLKPKGIRPFMKLTNDKAALRSSLLPFLGMFACDTGGTLNRVVHFYNYVSLEARDQARQRAAQHTEWQQDYLDHSRPHVAHQTSSLWMPAMPILHAARVVQPGQFVSPQSSPGTPPVLYELRSYQLTHGWGAVPAWVEAFASGVGSKIEAAASQLDPSMVPTLVFAGAREASRSAAPWRASVTEIAKVTQHFTVSYLHPVACSPWQ